MSIARKTLSIVLLVAGCTDSEGDEPEAAPVCTELEAARRSR